MVVGSGFTAGGLYFVAAFPLTGVAMYLLARSQGLSRVAGLVGGVLLANAPGHADRFGHLYLAQYWVVPIALWLVLEVGRGRPLWTGPVAGRRSRAGSGRRGGPRRRPQRGVLRRVHPAPARRGDPGATGRGAPRDLLRGLAVVLGLGLTIAVPLVLAKLGTAGDVVTGRVAATRLPSESETYAGKLMDLVLPWPEHRLEPLAFLSQAYNGTTQATVEVSALGLVGVVGLVMLTAWAWRRCSRGAGPTRTSEQWSGLALVSFLLYTVGGLGSFIAFFGTPQLRTWSRMSLYLLVLALLAVGLLLTRLERRRGLVVAVVVGGLVTVVGVADQTNPAAAPDHAAAATTMARLQDYVSTLQAATGPGCGVFQVPVVAYPESGQFVGMDDYDQIEPYLPRSSLKFSSGAMRGTAASTWQRSVDVTDLPALGEQLRAAGFCAIEVDTRGFTARAGPVRWAARGLRRPGGPHVRRRVRRLPAARPPTAADAARLSDRLLEPVLVTLEAYGDETVDGVVGQRVGPYAGLSIANLGERPREVTVSLAVRGQGPDPREVVVRDGDEVLARATVDDAALRELSFTTRARQGLTALTISVDGPADRSAVDEPVSTAFVTVRSASSTSEVRVAIEQRQVATGWVAP